MEVTNRPIGYISHLDAHILKTNSVHSVHSVLHVRLDSNFTRMNITFNSKLFLFLCHVVIWWLIVCLLFDMNRQEEGTKKTQEEFRLLLHHMEVFLLICNA